MLQIAALEPTCIPTLQRHVRQPGNIPTELPSWQASCNPEGLPIGPQRCELFGRNACWPTCRAGQSLDEVTECDHAHTLEPMGRLDFLNGREGALAAFLAIECQRHTGRFGPGGTNDLQGLA